MVPAASSEGSPSVSRQWGATAAVPALAVPSHPQCITEVGKKTRQLVGRYICMSVDVYE